MGREADPLCSELERLALAESDGLWLDAGRTVGVARSAAGLFVGWIDVGWVAPDDPFAELRDVAHLPVRPCPAEFADDLRIALDEARASRAERLRDCGRCGERFVPGQMHGTSCCHSCAVRSGDVVA